MNFRVPKLMHAVLLSGHGGMEKLEYRSDVDVPIPKDDEVLINVKAAGTPLFLYLFQACLNFKKFLVPLWYHH